LLPPPTLRHNPVVAKTEIKHPDKTASTGAYSAGVAIDGWLYVSGQGPLDLKTGNVVPGTVEEQTRLTLEHVGKILAEAGCSFDDVVKCTCHLRDIDDFDRFNGVYAQFFTGIRPARTTVQSVLWGGIKVEIDCVARIPGH
jgi:2-iminobutanoate/2-iminopropanoate deaminase